MADAEQTVQPRPAGTVLIARDAGAEVEILLGKRNPNMRFMAGAHVFPGGAVHESDRSAVLAERVRVGARAWQGGEDVELDRLHALAVIRETLEEVGLLLGCDPITENELALLRDAVRAGADFGDSLSAAGISLDLSVLTPLIRWITPRQEPIRFDTRFYVARAPANQTANADARETVDISWMTPTAAFEGAQAGRLRLSPPTRRTLEEVAAMPSVEALLEFAAQSHVPTIEPIIREIDGERVILYPGDPHHPVPRPALKGPTRAIF
jgi:8-oxo-dGTP pyrophosphatase MutT (NUDIX family)